ncbi:hypothetical protein CEXT_53691 [Caerostris extrusa]|uniref:Uncharacterized protein n=1 Tax=Caerostris extrusa TaxID=172846 RepID=A0AAV4X9C6_CAEEX|nr:hypothetical protein CEXT_53691 [Caerostris extrusa]
MKLPLVEVLQKDKMQHMQLPIHDLKTIMSKNSLKQSRHPRSLVFRRQERGKLQTNFSKNSSREVSPGRLSHTDSMRSESSGRSNYVTHYTRSVSIRDHNHIVDESRLKGILHRLLRDEDKERQASLIRQLRAIFEHPENFKMILSNRDDIFSTFEDFIQLGLNTELKHEFVLTVGSLGAILGIKARRTVFRRYDSYAKGLPKVKPQPKKSVMYLKQLALAKTGCNRKVLVTVLRSIDLLTIEENGPITPSFMTQIQKLLIELNHAVLAVRSVQIVEEFYKCIMVDITEAHRELLKSCSETLHSAVDQEIYKITLLSSICALVDIGNAKHSLIRMFAFKPSFFDLMINHLKLTEPNFRKFFLICKRLFCTPYILIAKGIHILCYDLCILRLNSHDPELQDEFALLLTLIPLMLFLRGSSLNNCKASYLQLSTKDVDLSSRPQLSILDLWTAFEDI